MEILFYKNVQVEQGSYISWFSGEMFSGDQIYDRSFTLSEIPLFVQAGSIIPLKTEDIGNNCIKYFTCVHGIKTLLQKYRSVRFSASNSNCAQIDGVCR